MTPFSFISKHMKIIVSNFILCTLVNLHPTVTECEIVIDNVRVETIYAKNTKTHIPKLLLGLIITHAGVSFLFDGINNANKYPITAIFQALIGYFVTDIGVSWLRSAFTPSKITFSLDSKQVFHHWISQLRDSATVIIHSYN